MSITTWNYDDSASFFEVVADVSDKVYYIYVQMGEKIRTVVRVCGEACKTSTPIDLTPIPIGKIEANGVKLRAKGHLSIRLELDESKQYICANRNDLGISVFSDTRQNIIRELHEQIIMLWQEYAMASDKELSLDAQELKVALRTTFKHAP
jgi:hypothetical protein